VGHQLVANEDRSGAWAEPADTRSWHGLDVVIGFIVVTSAVKILGCLALAITHSTFLHAGPIPTIVLIVHITIYGGAAIFLTTAGYYRDRRAVDLGGFFVVVASAFANGLAFRLIGLPSVSHHLQQALLAIQPEAFLPLFLWLFVTQFPHVRRFDRGQHVVRTRLRDFVLSSSLETSRLARHL
jgi:hypothetical protein